MVPVGSNATLSLADQKAIAAELARAEETKNIAKLKELRLNIPKLEQSILSAAPHLVTGDFSGRIRKRKKMNQRMDRLLIMRRELATLSKGEQVVTKYSSAVAKVAQEMSNVSTPTKVVHQVIGSRSQEGAKEYNEVSQQVIGFTTTSNKEVAQQLAALYKPADPLIESIDPKLQEAVMSLVHYPSSEI
jgi:NADH dehydrogenase/NADH:ubiquinone oxidoreductase subunit G